MNIMFRRKILGLSDKFVPSYGEEEYVVSVPLDRLTNPLKKCEEEDYHYFTQTPNRLGADTGLWQTSGNDGVILHDDETKALLHAYGAQEGYYSEDRKDILKRDKIGWRGSAFGGAHAYYFLRDLAGRSYSHARQPIAYHTMEKIRFAVLNYQDANRYSNTTPNYAHGVSTLDNMQFLSDIKANMITHSNKSDASTETLVAISHVNPNIQGYKTGNCIVWNKGFWNAFSNLYYEDYKTLETSQAEYDTKMDETKRILGWVEQIDSEITRATVEHERLRGLEKLCTKEHITKHLLKVFYYNDLMKEELQANTDLYRPKTIDPVNDPHGNNYTPISQYDSVVDYYDYTATPEWAAVLKNGSFNDLSYLWEIREVEDYLTTTPTLKGIDEAEEFYNWIGDKDLEKHFFHEHQVFPDIREVNEKQGAFDLLKLENRQLGEKITLTYKLLSQQLYMHLQDFICGKEMEEI
jgi:hypothetical protein